jgi:hypothetical protein
VQTAILKNAFYRVGGTEDEFMEPRGRWPEKSLGTTGLNLSRLLVFYNREALTV